MSGVSTIRRCRFRFFEIITEWGGNEVALPACRRAAVTFHVLVEFDAVEVDEHEENDGWREMISMSRRRLGRYMKDDYDVIGEVQLDWYVFVFSCTRLSHDDHDLQVLRYPAKC